MRIGLVSAVFVSIAVLAGCAKDPGPAPATVSVTSAREPDIATKGDTDSSLSPAMKIALADPNGTGEVDATIQRAQNMARKNPKNGDLWIVLGRAWIRKARESTDPGFYMNARACGDVVLADDPSSRLALDLQSLALLNDHKFEDARAVSQSIVDKYPEDPMAYGNLSDALLELGRYDEATDAAEKMIDLKPNLPSYSRVSHLAWLRGDETNAKESVRLAIDSGRDARDPEPRAWVLVQAGMMFWSRGDYDGADAGFDVALKSMPAYPPAMVGKGRVALARGEGARAADLLSRAYEASPLVETAWLLGDAREMAGDHAGAERAYASAAKEGRRTDPRTLSLFLTAKNRDVGEALRLANDEYTRRKDIYTEDAVAWALYRNGNIPEAKARIAKARRLGTKDAKIMFHDGAIRIAAGDVTGGKKLVADALALNPRFDVAGAEEAKKILQGS